MRVGNIVGMHGRMVFTRPIEAEDPAEIRSCSDCGEPSKVLVIESAPKDIYATGPAQHRHTGSHHAIHCWGWCMNCDIG